MNIGSNILYEGMKPFTINLAPGYKGLTKFMINAPFVIQTIEDADEQDTKTRIAQGIRSIPKGTELRVDSILCNWYGIFLEVEYKNRTYSIDPKICKYIRMPA